MKRVVYIVLGSVSLALGTLGTLLPVLPTVPFFSAYGFLLCPKFPKAACVVS